jgi:hypothetical protein
MDPAANTPPRPGEAGDHFLLWPLFVALGPPLLWGLVWAIVPLAFLGLALAVPFLGIATLATVILTGHHLQQRQWRRAVSMLVVPVYAALVALAPGIAVGPFVRLGVWAHFLADHSRYEAELAKIPSPRFRVFDWGGFAGTNLWLVYDEDDDIALPPARRHHPTDYEDVCPGPAGHLSGHYYFC